MDITANTLADLSAFGTIIVVVLFAVWRGIPALFAYLKQKDEEHRQDIMNLIAAAREERDTFYQSIGIKLDQMNDRLHTIENSIKSKTADGRPQTAADFAAYSSHPNS